MRVWLSLLLMILVIYSVRMVPMILFRKNITNRFFRSFLYYVPYVTLSVMTFPAIIHATKHPLEGVLALIAGIVTAWISKDLLIVAVTCCVTVLLAGVVI